MVRLTSFLVFVAVATVSCATPRAPVDRRFPIRGTIVATDTAERTLTVAHEPIEGFMDAMTMTLHVADDVDVRTVTIGDRITATLVVADRESVLTDVKRIDAAGAVEIASVADPVEGQPAPDFALVDQDGKPLTLRDFRGDTVAITFIYTRCPLPDYCALMTDHFAEVERALRSNPSLWSRTRLLSISIDPERDTPPVLAEYGRKAVAPAEPDFTHWSLATGDPDTIRQVAAAYGLSYETRSGQIVHSLRTAVVGPDGTLVRLLRGNKWTAEQLMQMLSS